MIVDLESRIYPVYQPVTDAFRRTQYWEALLRVQAADGMPLAEGDRLHIDLLNVAEKIGFISALDLHITKTSIDAAIETNVPLGINVSMNTIETEAQAMLDILRRARAVPGGIVVELTETGNPNELGVLADFAHRVKVLGGRIAIDDYGAGHFREVDIEILRPNIIKIDRARSWDAVNSDSARRFITNVVKIAQGIGAQTVAEGIETHDQMIVMRSLGVDAFQGFYLSRPVHLLQSNPTLPMNEVLPGSPYGKPRSAMAPVDWASVSKPLH